MPKVKASNQRSQQLVISPWIKKKTANLQEDDADGANERMWSVVERELLTAAGDRASASSASCLPGAPLSTAAARAPQSAAIPQPSVWHSRQRSREEQVEQQEQQQQQQQQAQGEQPAGSGGTEPPPDGSPASCAPSDHGDGDSSRDGSHPLSPAPSGDGSAGPSSGGASGRGAAAGNLDSLKGIARVALLPYGDLVGHLIVCGGGSDDGGGNGVAYGLSGRQVLGQRSCYRDTEWGLLLLSIVRFERPRPRAPGKGAGRAAPGTWTGSGGGGRSGRSSDNNTGGGGAAASSDEGPSSSGSEGKGEGEGGAEVTAWVQRSGGDLARLEPADPADEDTAEALAADGGGPGGRGGSARGGGRTAEGWEGEVPVLPAVHFSADTLLADAAADAALLQFAPRLVGRGAVVNVGPMRAEGLPRGFAPHSGGAGSPAGGPVHKRQRRWRPGAGAEGATQQGSDGGGAAFGGAGLGPPDEELW